MEDYKYLTYEEFKNLKKGTVIMHRDEFRNHKWCIGTFLGHFSAYGSAAMRFSFHADKKENPDYKSTTVFTGLQFYEHAWNGFEKWRNYRWPTEEELNADLLEQLSREKGEMKMRKTFMTRLIYISKKEEERVNGGNHKPNRKQRIDGYARLLSDHVKKGQI